MKTVTNVRYLEDDGKIVVRYSFSNGAILDATMDLPALALNVSDASTILCHAIQRRLNKEAA